MALFEPTTMPTVAGDSECHTDVLIIGCGIAGCSAALRAAKRGLRVTVLSKAKKDLLRENKSNDPDEAELLVSDIERAGCGRNDVAAVRKLASDGPGVVEEYFMGPDSAAEVHFDLDPADPSGSRHALCLEASHSRPRILHWGDRTGGAIMASMIAAVARHPLIELRTRTVALDLLMARSCGNGSSDRSCIGALILDLSTGQMTSLRAKEATILATGGCGDVYQHTSNCAGSVGDGIAMAIRAGVSTNGMEFMQFHPTSLYDPGQRSFLLTEALRGEGAVLRDRHGRSFAKEYHPDGELAPRDVVARMIMAEIAKIDVGGTGSNGTGVREGHLPCVFLDITHRGHAFLKARFPAIFEHCLKRGYDMSTQQLPVVPTAHYACGGVSVDLDGRTNLDGLWAAGECTSTGVHGANRLASTSLLEGLVWGSSAANHVAQNRESADRDDIDHANEGIEGDKQMFAANSQRVLPGQRDPPHVPQNFVPIALREVRLDEDTHGAGTGTSATSSMHGGHEAVKNSEVCPSHGKRPVGEAVTEIRRIMWEKVGICRRTADLEAAVSAIRRILLEEIEPIYRQVASEVAAEVDSATSCSMYASRLSDASSARNAATVALAITSAAASNKVSIGAHHVLADVSSLMAPPEVATATTRALL